MRPAEHLRICFDNDNVMMTVYDGDGSKIASYCIL